MNKIYKSKIPSSLINLSITTKLTTIDEETNIGEKTRNNIKFQTFSNFLIQSRKIILLFDTHPT